MKDFSKMEKALKEKHPFIDRVWLTGANKNRKGDTDQTCETSLHVIGEKDGEIIRFTEVAESDTNGRFRSDLYEKLFENIDNYIGREMSLKK